jgi:plasmid maintenance system antidote protein VapI
MFRIAAVKASDVLLQNIKAAGVKPVDLAEAIGVTAPMASMVLAGKRGISTKHLDAIAKLLKMPDASHLFVIHPNTKSVQKSTVQKSTGVAQSAVPEAAGTEGKHDPLVASTIDFGHLVGLSLRERVEAAAIIALQLNALLRGRPEVNRADAHQPKRSASRK